MAILTSEEVTSKGILLNSEVTAAVRFLARKGFYIGILRFDII